MQHLKSREIREKLYRASVTKASSGDTDNSVLIRDIMRKKKGVAKMLGYESYAELSLAEKMAPDVSTVLNLIQMLRDQSLPAAQKEFAELKLFAKEKGCESMDLWDVPYWSEHLREEKYEFEEEQLRVFFPLENVLTGMFALIERLFAVRIEAADGEQQVWHPDVRFFKIYESGAGAGADPIAGFYLDPFSRPEDKRGGAWMDVCVGKSKVMKRIPVAYLTCNGSPPTDGKPSLMTFREVETLFHGNKSIISHNMSLCNSNLSSGISSVNPVFHVTLAAWGVLLSFNFCSFYSSYWGCYCRCYCYCHVIHILNVVRVCTCAFACHRDGARVTAHVDSSGTW